MPRFVPPGGGFINFLAKVAESVSRYRCAKSGAMAQRPRNPPRGTNKFLLSGVYDNLLRGDVQ